MKQFSETTLPLYEVPQSEMLDCIFDVAICVSNWNDGSIREDDVNGTEVTGGASITVGTKGSTGIWILEGTLANTPYRIAVKANKWQYIRGWKAFYKSVE